MLSFQLDQPTNQFSRFLRFKIWILNTSDSFKLGGELNWFQNLCYHQFQICTQSITAQFYKPIKQSGIHKWIPHGNLNIAKIVNAFHYCPVSYCKSVPGSTSRIALSSPQKYPTFAIFLTSWWFKDVKNYIPKCSIHKYRITDTNTQILVCQKDRHSDQISKRSQVSCVTLW